MHGPTNLKKSRHHCDNLISRNSFAVRSMKFQVGEDLDEDILASHTLQSAEPAAFIPSTAVTATLFRDKIPPTRSRISSFLPSDLT